MNLTVTTRDRLLDAASELFAEAGFRGAAVRDICNLAGTNPGAVSYHFGGKRQLYRAVLRRAADRLAGAGLPPDDTEPESPPTIEEVVLRVMQRVIDDNTAARLLLRDLADGGTVAVEALTPPLRAAFQKISIAVGEADTSRAGGRARRLFLALAAPLFLLTAAWPVIAQVLDLEADRREALLEDILERALASSAPAHPQITQASADH